MFGSVSIFDPFYFCDRGLDLVGELRSDKQPTLGQTEYSINNLDRTDSWNCRCQFVYDYAMVFRRNCFEVFTDK